MTAPLTTYLMAFSAMIFAATSALVLFRWVDHLDPTEVSTPEEKSTLQDVAA